MPSLAISLPRYLMQEHGVGSDQEARQYLGGFGLAGTLALQARAAPKQHRGIGAPLPPLSRARCSAPRGKLRCYFF